MKTIKNKLDNMDILERGILHVGFYTALFFTSVTVCSWLGFRDTVSGIIFTVITIFGIGSTVLGIEYAKLVNGNKASKVTIPVIGAVFASIIEAFLWIVLYYFYGYLATKITVISSTVIAIIILHLLAIFYTIMGAICADRFKNKKHENAK